MIWCFFTRHFKLVDVLGDDLHFSISEKDHKLDEGDIILVLGPSGEISKFKKDVAYA